MDLSKIFLKDACPTPVGGQAVMEGIMMRGLNRTAIACRLPDGRIHMKTQPNKEMPSWTKIPVLRGVVSFVMSLVNGMSTLMYSADVMEANWPEEEIEEDKLEKWLNEKFGPKAAWNLMMTLSVVFAIGLTVVFFILLPTVVANFVKPLIDSVFMYNLIEGVIRIAMFVIYIMAISKMKDIQTVFEYHGAEHKTIHCFENGLEMTPANAQQFYTLHPRCGTSFLLFVMVISFVLHLFMGWPDLVVRIVSRLLILPVVAGLSYELLKWAGRSDNIVVKILSLPGLYLQKLTTNEPNDAQLEVAIAAMKAVLVDDDTPYFEGICDLDGNFVEKNEKMEAKKNEPIS